MALLSRGTVAQSTQLIVYLHMLSDVCPRLAEPEARLWLKQEIQSNL